MASLDRKSAVVLGIDPASSQRKPTACALLDGDGSLLTLASPRTDAEIIALAQAHRPAVVAIDSPLGFPRGMCCLEEDCDCRSVHEFKGRTCERELISRGIGLYVTTKRSFIKPLIYRAIGLAGELAALGCEVIEVYPHAAKVYLFGKPIPPKTTPEGRAFLRQRLNDLVPGLPSRQQRLGHDLCDALVAAYTACLHARGQSEALGLDDEVPIIVPRAG